MPIKNKQKQAFQVNKKYRFYTFMQASTKTVNGSKVCVREKQVNDINDISATLSRLCHQNCYHHGRLENKANPISFLLLLFPESKHCHKIKKWAVSFTRKRILVNRDHEFVVRTLLEIKTPAIQLVFYMTKCRNSIKQKTVFQCVRKMFNCKQSLFQDKNFKKCKIICCTRQKIKPLLMVGLILSNDTRKSQKVNDADDNVNKKYVTSKQICILRRAYLGFQKLN